MDFGGMFGSSARILTCRKGGASVQAALMFGAVAIALAVLVTPQVEKAADIYAQNRALGIDRVLTGSIEKSRRYSVRKSVLDE